MPSELLTPAYAPFALSFVVMLGVGIIEAIGLGLGQLDLEPDLGEAPGSASLDWLGIGERLPILIWLTALLGCFTLAGVVIQQAATAIVGHPLHWGAATGGATVAGLLLNVAASRGLARIMPGYESSAISSEDLVMRRATILEGSARRGHPARGKIVDQHGQAHYAMIEPHRDGDVIAAGERGLLVRREAGLFYMLPDTDTALRSL